MIKYRLKCVHGHEFEGWFQSSAAFDTQALAGQIACPVCGSTSVEKAMMAPRVATSETRARASGCLVAEAREMMRNLKAEVEKQAEYVGPRFAEEARRIHFDEAAPRSVYGEASPQEVRSLLEDGVPVLPLPRLPEEQN